MAEAAPTRSRTDAGRVLRLGYAVFVVAAGGRAAVQLAVDPGRAPLAYGLSALAAAVYLAGLILLTRAERGGSRTPAAVCCGLELAGVLGVGTASVLAPAALGAASVWSRYGSGYGWVPLVLPLLALWRLVVLRPYRNSS